MRIKDPQFTRNLSKESTPSRLNEACVVRGILHGLEKSEVLDFIYICLPLRENHFVSCEGLTDGTFLRDEEFESFSPF